MSLNLARNGFPEAMSRGAGGALRVATPCAASQTTVANSAQATPKPNARVPIGSPARVRLSLAFMRRSPLRSAAAFIDAAGQTGRQRSTALRAKPYRAVERSVNFGLTTRCNWLFWQDSLRSLMSSCLGGERSKTDLTTKARRHQVSLTGFGGGYTARDL